MSNRFTWMHSGQIGAPQMNGAAGSNGQMLQVLDGCLINGFNPQTVTIATKTATTVTLTFGVAHGYELLQIISVSGATDMSLNGRHRITAKTTNTVTIDAVGVSDTTGTIVTKVAPLGFESLFGSEDTLRRAYRSTDERSKKTVLYLDMNLPTGHGYNATNPAKRAMVSLCEDMTTIGVQINSYTNNENNYITNPNGRLFWYQARGQARADAVTQAAAFSWVIVGNGKVFYLFNEWRTYQPSALPLRDFFAFGDAESLDGEVSVNNCFWLGSLNTNDVTNIRYTSTGATIGTNPSTIAGEKGLMVSSQDGTGAIEKISIATGGIAPNVFDSGVYGTAGNFPNPSTKKTLGFSMQLMKPNEPRATLSGLLAIPQNLGGDYPLLDKKVSGSSLLIAVGTSGAGASVGFFVADLGV